jgi:hypothetical protein
MSNKQERARAEVENALMAISNADVLLDNQVRLRIQQAIQRDPRMHNLLGPALEVVERAQHAIRLSKQVIAGVWENGEHRHWS